AQPFFLVAALLLQRAVQLIEFFFQTPHRPARPQPTTLRLQRQELRQRQRFCASQRAVCLIPDSHGQTEETQQFGGRRPQRQAEPFAALLHPADGELRQGEQLRLCSQPNGGVQRQSEMSQHRAQPVRQLPPPR